MSAPVTVTIVETRGSVPRDPGTAMQIFPAYQIGTIGGGALEHQATQTAREMLKQNQAKRVEKVPLGPALGQCCGGSVTLEYTRQAPRKHRNQPPIWIWGAGHVGRAIVSVLAPLEDRELTWVDTSVERFPDAVPEHVNVLVAGDPARVIGRAPKHASHVILTYSHSIDLELCNGLLHHSFAFTGLIGSATKLARFRKRLAELGHPPDKIARITCPIGDRALGKHPQAIAIGVAAALLKHDQDLVAQERTA